jgi:DNA-3-methyladenine glycosylase
MIARLKPPRQTRSRTSILRQGFYERSPELVARELLGKLFVRRLEGERLVGRIIEVEAYLGQSDPASHAYGPKTPYNAVLYGPPGRTDVYLSYGVHYCVNFSCLPDGQPGGVLIRALDPLKGIPTMAKLRGLPEASSAKQLTGGPGRVCQALNITRAADHDIDATRLSSCIHVLEDGFHPKKVLVTPRVGISKASDLPLRFVLAEATSKARLATFPR